MPRTTRAPVRWPSGIRRSTPRTRSQKVLRRAKPARRPARQPSRRTRAPSKRVVTHRRTASVARAAPPKRQRRPANDHMANSAPWELGYERGLWPHHRPYLPKPVSPVHHSRTFNHTVIQPPTYGSLEQRQPVVLRPAVPQHVSDSSNVPGYKTVTHLYPTGQGHVDNGPAQSSQEPLLLTVAVLAEKIKQYVELMKHMETHPLKDDMNQLMNKLGKRETATHKVFHSARVYVEPGVDKEQVKLLLRDRVSSRTITHGVGSAGDNTTYRKIIRDTMKWPPNIAVYCRGYVPSIRRYVDVLTVHGFDTTDLISIDRAGALTLDTSIQEAAIVDRLQSIFQRIWMCARIRNKTTILMSVFGCHKDNNAFFDSVWLPVFTYHLNEVNSNLWVGFYDQFTQPKGRFDRIKEAMDQSLWNFEDLVQGGTGMRSLVFWRSQQTKMSYVDVLNHTFKQDNYDNILYVNASHPDEIIGNGQDGDIGDMVAILPQCWSGSNPYLEDSIQDTTIMKNLLPQ